MHTFTNLTALIFYILGEENTTWLLSNVNFFGFDGSTGAFSAAVNTRAYANGSSDDKESKRRSNEQKKIKINRSVESICVAVPPCTTICQTRSKQSKKYENA